ncbi:MAG TPA: hypothetical protein VGK19_13890 [Capsulimonadaceae bacterium]|jgi:hypothetical protein
MLVQWHEITERLRLAQGGFMAQNVVWQGDACRPIFASEILPRPLREESQWDHGDTTARALYCWAKMASLGEIGESDSGVIRGLEVHFSNILSPLTGMAFVPEYSEPEEGDYYYHMWDQGRVLEYLLLDIELRGVAAAESMQRAKQLIAGVTQLAVRKSAPDGSTYLEWESDAYWNGSPTMPEGRHFGKYCWHGWCIVSSQLVGPVARLSALTGDSALAALAAEIGTGYLVGGEHRRGSTTPTFDRDGRFYGQYHGNACGVLGLCNLADLYDLRGDIDGAASQRGMVVQIYHWMMGRGASNENVVSSCGYAPETSAPERWPVSELCSTVDIVELAMRLARYAEAGVVDCDARLLWDDVERCVVNELFLRQVTDPGKCVAEGGGRSDDDSLSWLDGTWASCRSFLCDHGQFPPTGSSAPNMPGSDAEGGSNGQSPNRAEALGVRMTSGACCAYHGVRALLAVRDALIDESGTDGGSPTVTIRSPFAYESASVSVIADGESGWYLLAKRDCVVHVLKSLTADLVMKADCLTERDYWFECAVRAGDKLSWSVTPQMWTSYEVAGSVNSPTLIGGVGDGRAIDTQFSYCGNKIVSMEPRGIVMPYLKGL